MGESNKVQIYSYPAIVLKRDDNTISLVYCERTGLIVSAFTTGTMNAEAFNNTKLDWQVERLRKAGWHVSETYERTDI